MDLRCQRRPGRRRWYSTTHIHGPVVRRVVIFTLLDFTGCKVCACVCVGLCVFLPWIPSHLQRWNSREPGSSVSLTFPSAAEPAVAVNAVCTGSKKLENSQRWRTCWWQTLSISKACLLWWQKKNIVNLFVSFWVRKANFCDHQYIFLPLPQHQWWANKSLLIALYMVLHIIGLILCYILNYWNGVSSFEKISH